MYSVFSLFSIISTKDLIVFFLGRSTTFPGPIVHGPPKVATNLVLIPMAFNKLMATWKAAPVARFYLWSLGMTYASASSY